MKILHTESSMGWGGQEIRIILESQALCERGHEVLIAANPGSQIYSRLPPTLRLPVNLKSKSVASLICLSRVLSHVRPDLIVCHSSTDHWLAALARLFFKKKIPIVRARHISTPISNTPTTKWLYRHGCEFITTTGKSIECAIINQCLVRPENIKSVPTGIDGAAFTLCQAQARRELNFRADCFLIGIVATLRSWKGHEHLIRAFHSLPRTDCVLVVVGDGPQKAALVGLAASLGLSDRIIFAGQRNDVARWFASLDLFVLPSYANEGVPQAILQAMATGLPIITCPVGGIPEAVAQYGAFEFVPSKDPKALAFAIDKAIARKMDKPSRAELTQVPFSIESMAISCEKIYKSVVHDYNVH